MAELLANTLNLASAGQTALDAICDMTPLVPVDRPAPRHAPPAVAPRDGPALLNILTRRSAV